MIYIKYLVLACLVVFLSVRLSFYVDALDKKTNLSGAFIGGVMLAAVTSLPELFTSLTAVLQLGEPQLVQGNVLGSNIFNLCVIGGIVLYTSKRYQSSRIAGSHKHTLFYSLVMYGLVLTAIWKPIVVDLGFFHVNVMTLAILGVYIINVKNMNDDSSNAAEDEGSAVALSVGQILFRFASYSVALVIVSILLTYVTDTIAQELQLGTTVAGAIFLGVATSLPELSASINLVRIGNYNASFGNIVGSNLFNFTILCFADFLYASQGIYTYETQVLNLLMFGTVSTILALGVIVGKQKRGVVMLCCIGILVSYLASIALSI